MNSILLLDFEFCFLPIRRDVSKTHSKERTKSAYALRLYAGFQQNCETGKIWINTDKCVLENLTGGWITGSVGFT